MAKKIKPECMTPGCRNSTYSRGLCNSCYQIVRTMVKHGETSWEEMENLGKTAKKKTPAGPGSFRKDWFRSK